VEGGGDEDAVGEALRDVDGQNIGHAAQALF
jgi:hypothetical protein